MNPLDAPVLRCRFNITTNEPCSECFFVSLGSDKHFVQERDGEVWVVDGECALHGSAIANPLRAHCPAWVNGRDCICEEEHEEDEFHLKESCPWCNYSVERTARNCQFEPWKKALKHLVGVHIMNHHADKIADAFALLTGSFSALASAAVDATRRLGKLADYARRMGSVTGDLNKDARGIQKM